MPQVLPEEEAVSVSVICLVGGGGGRRPHSPGALLQDTPPSWVSPFLLQEVSRAVLLWTWGWVR